MMTEDHPYDYASFEGVIPAGNYGAGNVIIWDEGRWEFIEPGDDPVKALQSGKLTFRLFGKKMFGEWALVKIRGRAGSARGNEWLLLKHRDAFANEEIDVTEVAPRSVVSNLLVEEIGGENIWISDRPASSRKAPTLASRVEPARTESSSRRVAKSPRKSAAPGKPVGNSKKRATKRQTAAPSRSRAAAPKTARSTARRRPR
jgi:bifunctional non-homologous end joining protein LigD